MHFKKNRAIREAEALKWLWPHARPQQQHLLRVVTRASGSLSGSKQLSTWWPRVSHCLKSTVARAGEDGYPRWKEIRCNQASGCCCSRAFCPGKGLTPTWGGLEGAGECCRCLERWWGGVEVVLLVTTLMASLGLGTSCFLGLSAQQRCEGHFCVLSVFESSPSGKWALEDAGPVRR